MEFANRVLGEGFKYASWHLQLIGTAASQQRKGLARVLVEVITNRVGTTRPPHATSIESLARLPRQA
jgi:hypothetical protein